MEKTRLRIRFTKCGDLRWISHRDLARLWERLLRRADLQLAFSQGFHPKPRINFPSALALGIEALDEIVELEVLGEVALESIGERISSEMPEGMELLTLDSPAYALGKARVAGASYRVLLSEADRQELKVNIDRIMAQDELTVQRDKKSVRCSVSDPYFDIALDGDYLTFSIPNIADGSIRPSELLVELGLAKLLESGAVLQRTQVHMKEPEKVPAGN